MSEALKSFSFEWSLGYRRFRAEWQVLPFEDALSHCLSKLLCVPFGTCWGSTLLSFEAFMNKGATGTTPGLSSNGTAEASSSSPQASFLGVCVCYSAENGRNWSQRTELVWRADRGPPVPVYRWGRERLREAAAGGGSSSCSLPAVLWGKLNGIFEFR